MPYPYTTKKPTADKAGHSVPFTVNRAFRDGHIHGQTESLPTFWRSSSFVISMCRDRFFHTGIADGAHSGWQMPSNKIRD